MRSKPVVTPDDSDWTHPMSGMFGPKGMDGTVENFVNSCPTLGLHANSSISPLPGASIVPKWKKHGLIFIYRPSNDTWIEVGFAEKKITNIYLRLDSLPPRPWSRKQPKDGIFSPSGKEKHIYASPFIKSLIRQKEFGGHSA